MSDNTLFYHLSTTTNDPCELTEACYSEAQRMWLCPGCAMPLPHSGPIHVTLAESKIIDKPLNFVASVGVGLALRSFLYQVGRSIVDRDLILGQVFGADGMELDDWCTYRGRQRLIVRGCDDPDDENDRASFRQCEDCGRICYDAGGMHYLFPAPAASAEVFEDFLSLVLPDYLFARLEIPKNAKILVEPLTVLKSPLDGFGVLE